LIKADQLRLEQVLTNLLDNAIKYSPEGGPIDIELVVPNDLMVSLSVTDKGLGIPLEHRDHIFDLFYQAHSKRKLGGMGLGLYISREIVELHGGKLEVGFPPDRGTCFTLHLPVGVSDTPLFEKENQA
jgi:two-component system sensor histidine kinase VicK